MIQEKPLFGRLQRIICCSDCAIDKGNLISLIPLGRLFKFVMADTSLTKHAFGKLLSVIPTKHLQKMHGLDFTKITCIG